MWTPARGIVLECDENVSSTTKSKAPLGRRFRIRGRPNLRLAAFRRPEYQPACRTVIEDTNVTDDDPIVTGKIALAHMKEFPDYYTRLIEPRTHIDAQRPWLSA